VESDEEEPVEKIPVPESTLAEQRKAAAERVKRKLKEDQERVERAAAAKEAELRAQREASEIKARELIARTASRVEQYKEETLRKQAEQKAIAEYEQQQRELVNKAYLNSVKFQKMKEIRREAKNR
jgi:glucan biosynthesis protein